MAEDVAENTDEAVSAQAQEFAPGELASAIITSKKVWKPDDIKKVDPTLIAVFTTMAEQCSQADEAARRFSVLQVWEERHMDRGYQYLDGGQGGGWEIIGAGVGKNKNGLAANNDANLYATNILSAQGDISTSALCRGKIKVNFTPNKSKSPIDVACSDESNKYKHLWYETNDSITKQRELAGLAWTDPRGVFWTRTVADKSFGLDDDGNIRRREITTLHGVLETKGPMMNDCLKEMGYFQIFEESDYAIERAKYPWMGTKIKPSWGTAGELEFERIARINTRIGIVGKYITGTSGIREATVGYQWYRPGMYFDDRITDSQREWLLKEFPEGVFMIMHGKEFTCAWTESMDDHLALGMFCRGFGQNRRSLGSSDIPIQKRINIWADLWDITVRGAIAATAVDDQAFNMEALTELEASPKRFIPVSVPEGRPITDLFSQMPQAQLHQGMAEMFQWYVGPLIQSIDGCTPALFGEAEGSDNTVGATQIRLQQALERLGAAWIVANVMFATAIGQAARCCSQNGQGEISDTVEGYGDIAVNPENLKGNAKCRPETINAIPESGAQREAKVLQVLDMAMQNQEVAAVVARPSNTREIVKALSLEDVITVDEANWEDGALEDIERLLDSEPLINPEWQKLNDQLEQMSQTHEMAKSLAQTATESGIALDESEIQQGEALEQQVGQLQEQIHKTPQYLPSVTVAQDDSEDHATIAATVFSWMGESDGRSLRRKAEKDKPGQGDSWKKWTNVFLYWQGHKQVAAKLAAENQQPIPPKTSINIAVDKLVGAAQSQALSKAGIQVAPEQAGGPTEQEQETIQRTSNAEIKTRTKRKL
jgi:uncharacterized protein YecA (UPF0149 family)